MRDHFTGCAGQIDPFSLSCGIPWTDWISTPAPVQHSSSSSGIFSIASGGKQKLVLVGGDYKKPTNSKGAAAYTTDSGQHWQAPQTPPHGYRSSVAYDAQQKLWITVGPNGTDISTDDGRNWRALKPSPTDPPDADKDWNALSLPYVVGPNGRIGKLRPINLNEHLSGKE